MRVDVVGRGKRGACRPQEGRWDAYLRLALPLRYMHVLPWGAGVMWVAGGACRLQGREYVLSLKDC